MAAETMSAENDPPKLAVNFDLTDIEDIDGMSDGIDAEPSSDDDTFISYKKKKPTKRRFKDEIHSRIERDTLQHQQHQQQQPHHRQDSVSSASSDRQELEPSRHEQVQAGERLEEKIVVEKQIEIMNNNSSPQMCPPTEHFNELEKKMNGPGWMITSSSACSEDELGANERDEFTFKMCQIIKKSHRFNTKKKNNKNKQVRELDPEMIESTITVTELGKSENESGTDDEKQVLKFCCGNVPLVALREDDL